MGVRDRRSWLKIRMYQGVSIASPPQLASELIKTFLLKEVWTEVLHMGEHCWSQKICIIKWKSKFCHIELWICTVIGCYLGLCLDLWIWRSWGVVSCQWLQWPPNALWMVGAGLATWEVWGISGGHAAIGALLIWVACAATGLWWHPDWAALEGPVLICSPAAVGICVSMGVIGPILCWASPAFHWPWDGWSCPSLNTAAGKLVLPLGESSFLHIGKMVPHIIIDVHLTWEEH